VAVLAVRFELPHPAPRPPLDCSCPPYPCTELSSSSSNSTTHTSHHRHTKRISQRPASASLCGRQLSAVAHGNSSLSEGTSRSRGGVRSGEATHRHRKQSSLAHLATQMPWPGPCQHQRVRWPSGLLLPVVAALVEPVVSEAMQHEPVHQAVHRAPLQPQVAQHFLQKTRHHIHTCSCRIARRCSRHLRSQQRRTCGNRMACLATWTPQQTLAHPQQPRQAPPRLRCRQGVQYWPGTCTCKHRLHGAAFPQSWIFHVFSRP